MNSLGRTIHILLVAALVLSGISPACKFISGEMSLIEICAADGSLKTIKVSADQSPLPSEEQDSHHAADPCAFCFTNSNLKPLAIGEIAFFVPEQAQDSEIFESSGFLQNLSFNAYASRAPPSLLA